MFHCKRKRCPFAIAVLCPDADRERVTRALAESASWIPEEELSPVELDRSLAALLDKVCPKEILAAAAIAKLWKEGPVSGGVIGSPHRSSESANARLEEIAPSLWCWAYPGASGFMMTAGREEAQEAVRTLYACISKGEEPWPEFIRFVKQRPEILSFLFASDASGKKGRLCVGNRMEMQEIEL